MQLVVTCFIVYLNSDLSCSAFKEEICKSVILIDVIKVELRIEISGFFSTESIGEKLDKKVLPLT